METINITVTPMNGVMNGEHDGLEHVDAVKPGEIDIHTAARHGTTETVERLTQLSGEEVLGLSRGAVESTPVHDAAAAGNIATLTWLLANTGSHPSAVYIFFCCCEHYCRSNMVEQQSELFR